MVWGGIAHGVKSQLIIVEGNVTAIRYRDEILRPVAATSADFTAGQCPAIRSQSLSGFSGKQLHRPTGLTTIQSRFAPIEHLWDDLDRRVRKRQNPPNHSRTLKKCFGG